MWHHSKITVSDAGICGTELCMIRLDETSEEIRTLDPAHHRLGEELVKVQRYQGIPLGIYTQKLNQK